MKSFTVLYAENGWILHLFFIVFITALIQALSARLLTRLITKAERTKIILDEAMLKAVYRPSSVLIWVLGLSISISLISQHTQVPALFHYVPVAKRFIIVILMTWSFVRFIRNMATLHIESSEAKGKEVDKTLVHAVSQLLVISVVITSILASMQLFGLPISGLLAFGGIGGAGIAFASKDLLANFFGGLVIYLDRPFKVGDWIRSPDRSIEGVVEYIGWRGTRIRTFDKRPLYVPNGVFLTISVENPSRMSNRRIKATIGIRYQDANKMDLITASIKSMLQNHEEIDTNQTLIVNFVEFGPSSLNFLVYTFTKTTNWVKFQQVQHDVLLKILTIIESMGAACAFPTQTLFLEKELIKESHVST